MVAKSISHLTNPGNDAPVNAKHWCPTIAKWREMDFATIHSSCPTSGLLDFTTLNPWLNPWFVGIYVGESNHSAGFLRCRSSSTHISYGTS